MRLHFDFAITTIILALIAYSLSLIWSTNQSFLIPQIIFFVIGLFLFLLISQLNKDTFKNFAPLFYFACLVFLLITLVSPEVRGTHRWIEIFRFHFQPSELTKPFFIVSFSYFLTEKKINSLFSFLQLVLLFLFPVVIIFIQPDLGNVIVYFFFILAMVFANQLDLRVIFSSFLLLLLGSPFIWKMLRSYQKGRILSFLSPQSDPQGAGYNSIQAMIAVGSGKLFGQGLGRGPQSHLRFLPENHTDFIFASLTEEMGLFGAFLLLFFYGYILYRILSFAQETDDKFSYLVIIGIFSQILIQVVINISMNIGLIPITGVTLPLISSGGSSILGTMIALAIVIAISRPKRKQPLVIR